MKTIIQVAGIIDREEAAMLVQAGVLWLGFPLRLAVHKEDLSEEEAAAIVRALPPSVHAVVITYAHHPEEIAQLCAKVGTRLVQLHGPVTSEELASLRHLAPGLSIIKSLIVRGDNEAELAHMVKQLAPRVDAFITDSHDPGTGACGATGKTHDWAVSGRLVKASPRPVILAGGLNPGNVRRAILEVQPAGVDAHTGLEGRDGRKDQGLVEAFMGEARSAFLSLRTGNEDLRV